MIHAEARIYLTRKHALLPAKSPAGVPVFKSDRLLDLLGGSPSAQANLQVSTILRIVETPSEYLFSLNKPHFSSF